MGAPWLAMGGPWLGAVRGARLVTGGWGRAPVRAPARGSRRACVLATLAAAPWRLSRPPSPDSPPLGRSLPHTVVHALGLNANPAAAAQILRELSWMYDQQTHNRLSWISSFIEPAFIVLLGKAVGFYVVAGRYPLGVPASFTLHASLAATLLRVPT